jgi:hypothetical protein
MKPQQAARWVAQGVPGLYAAARSAGLGRLAAYRVLQASAYALAIAKQRYPRRWREENAVRHVIWQAWLTATYGREVAQAIGAAHERIATDRVDSTVDRDNNRIGQEYGAAHAAEIRGQAMRPALSELAVEAGRMFDAGLLRYQPRATRGTGSGT